MVYLGRSYSSRENKMSNKGFTLIEFVVVILILGILPVTAVPKFINLKADAQTSTLQGIKAAMEGASALVYGKCIVKGNHKEPFGLTNTVNIGGDGGINSDGELFVVYGHPIGNPDEFQRLLALDSQYTYVPLGTNFTTFAIYFSDSDAPTSTSEDCIVYYIAAAGVGKSPTIQVNDCV